MAINIWIKNKKGVIPPAFIILGVIASIIAVLSFAGYIDIKGSVASITGTGQYIERPVFYYDKCEAVSSYKYSVPTSLADDGQWLPKPSVTNQYDVKIKIVSTEFSLGGYRVEHYVCNSRVASSSNCRVYSKKQSVVKGSIVDISNVKPEEDVWVQYQKNPTGFDWRASGGATYQIGFIPYGIRQYNVLGGSPNQINPNDCTYPSKQSDTIISTDADKVGNYEPSKNTNERVLQPEEVRWYVAGYLTSASPSFALRYGGKDAWCRPTGTSAEIYQINEIQTAGGTYRIASVDWSDYLGSETCCPSQVRGDEVCNDNFQWEMVAGSECSAFNPCGSPNWVPYSEGKLIKYSCVNGYCESEIKEVECASDYDCKDANEICDLNTYTCVDANVDLDGQEIITIPDNKADCEEKGGVWITETSERLDILSWLGITKPKVIVEEYCELKKPFNWALIGIIIVAVIFIYVFRYPLLAGLRFVLSKIGIKI